MPVGAQIYADLDTSEGKFSIELDYQLSPQAAANFIRLAQGTPPWADPATGEVRRDIPFYNGQTFHEAVPNIGAGFGAPTGSREDDPGWVFQDDFRSVGFFFYTAFMDNRGTDGGAIPNNNGSRVFITIPQVPTELQGDFTLLGPVQAATFPIGGSGYDTVDAISNASPGTVTINNVQIRRVGTLATLFNENAQGLASLREAELVFNEKSGGLYLDWNPVAGTVCRFWKSEDIMTWSHRFEEFNYPGKTPLGFPVDDCIESRPKAFFRGAEVIYPVLPSTQRALNLARIQCDFFDNSFGPNPPPTRLQFLFNVQGDGGTWSEPGGGGGVFTVDEFTPLSPFTSILQVRGTGLAIYRFLLHYDRDGFNGQTEQISRLGGENLSGSSQDNSLADGTWIYLPAP